MNVTECLEIYADAEFYDLEFTTRDFEIPFYRKHARNAEGAVLEVACGTGRLTLPLARDGIDVTGLDISQSMLNLARKKSITEGLDIEWLEQDCRNMHLPRKYALVFSATNAMQHLLDLDSVCAFLQSARRALEPGGRLILDVFNPDPGKLLRPSTERYLHKEMTMADGRTLRVETASHYDCATQILHFDLYYLNGDEVIRTKRVDMRCFYPEELLALCRLNDLDVLERFGSYEEEAFIGTSPKQILVCREARPWGS